MITYRSQMVAYGLSHIATAAVVSGFWWFGLDFAIASKLTTAKDGGVREGYRNAAGMVSQQAKFSYEAGYRDCGCNPMLLP